eukprot:2733170-Amphidinium_carterae.1
MELGSSCAHLGAMLQWRMQSGIEERLSVPRRLAQEVKDLLEAAHQRSLDRSALRDLADKWEVVATEIRCDRKVVPAIFLLRRDSMDRKTTRIGHLSFGQQKS